MKILQVHEAYQFFSGEDVVVEAEYEMLREAGEEVQQWIEYNDVLNNMHLLQQVLIASSSIWSLTSYREAKQRLESFRPDVVHVHNTIPLISPAIYTASFKLHIPVVQTLHNFKTVCPGAFMYRAGKTCDDCLGKRFPYPALLHGCYRTNRLHTAVAVAGLVANRTIGSYHKHVSSYIALTQFAREKYIEGGLPAERIEVKPNFVDSGICCGNHNGDFALFAGKLEPFKGVLTLLKAWTQLEEHIPLKIVGRGPLETNLKSKMPQRVELLGSLPREEVIRLMQEAAVVIFPSEWYEGFPMTITEAFATGTAVIASRLAAMAEIVRDGDSGWHFRPGDWIDLAAKVAGAWANPSEMRRRGERARQQYEQMYCSEKNYDLLMDIYRKAIARVG